MENSPHLYLQFIELEWLRSRKRCNIISVGLRQKMFCVGMLFQRRARVSFQVDLVGHHCTLAEVIPQ